MKKIIFGLCFVIHAYCLANYVTTCQTLPNGQTVCTNKKAGTF